ncbi:hypothetical protein [Myroides odoratimimus]|uniref:hypothetical protein n=1 Tax=Myroides odoratimimus TaxID=76832 RepID=UPI0025779AB5|nr:hypothetical protein [Myroides odoratimimus]MDM1464036.1 hypothetical protein [Myroides odoratimimus]MDM1473902.1 hypothetical protein [Myroides odoratimimus]
MTVQELIKELEMMPKDMPVNLFDWRKNLGLGFGENSSEGVYDKFEISIQEIATEDEMRFHIEQYGEEFRPWVSISFENTDYNDDGELID